VKVRLLHRGIATSDFRALPEVKIRCTVLMRSGNGWDPAAGYSFQA